jgi:hypothetical protein
MSKIFNVYREMNGINAVDENGFTNLKERLFVVEKALDLVEDLAGVPSGISVEEAEFFRDLRRQVREFRVKESRDGRFDYDEIPI